MWTDILKLICSLNSKCFKNGTVSQWCITLTSNDLSCEIKHHWTFLFWVFSVLLSSLTAEKKSWLQCQSLLHFSLKHIPITSDSSMFGYRHFLYWVDWLGQWKKGQQLSSVTYTGHSFQHFLLYKLSYDDFFFFFCWNIPLLSCNVLDTPTEIVTETLIYIHNHSRFFT